MTRDPINWREVIKQGPVSIFTYKTLWWWYARAKRDGSYIRHEGEGRAMTPKDAAEKARRRLYASEDRTIADRERDEALSDPRP
ncbi:MAG: hypothetical protein EON55_22825 [Alphaproteobacteria bacterium]|nr:MAG: hypothetical protein EON55_22825 [Alphaproteobacteria bacterium]